MKKVFHPNDEGKFEFTKEELKQLLDEIYNAGYNDCQSNLWIYTTPHRWNTSPYITCNPSQTTKAPSITWTATSTGDPILTTGNITSGNTSCSCNNCQ